MAKNDGNSANHAHEPRLLTAEVVADYLGVTRGRLYELCREDLVPHIRMGRQLRFSPTELATWIELGGTAYPGGWRKEAVE